MNLNGIKFNSLVAIYGSAHLDLCLTHVLVLTSQLDNASR